ncbi:YhcN/YlaJ family sporulation lipoprotein [Ornithinibacillus sp. L9]|uniref:YhcN/YlaJ family sporulation lipoprotein n=1 Tax=Ornithinibacillus caprae TaxID=2678566 RepID=A0A6N8FH63_9BACI|nr:YhcN/YlaJ family sporulation lipoprotein [Ornithinibacillus caprae]MUK88785.1 YhcN/YlaJ family sporulation lipoprotein [Ornithinibacillus caprae]
MKWKILSLVTASFISLAACQAADEQGQRYDNNDANNNIEQTRFGNGYNTGNTTNNNTGDNFNRDRNYTMDRDIEERNNRNNITNTRNQNNQGNQQNTRYDVADEASDQITSQIDEIERAYVLTTDNNAYVAAGLDNGDRRNSQYNNLTKNNNNRGDELTDEVKDQIGDIVKSVDNDIDNVYVSTNPDFVDLTNNYVNDMNNGEPIEGFFDQMGNMIERLFPQNR